MSDLKENVTGAMPCKPFDMVDVWFRDGDLSSGFASDFYWKIDHDIADIIKYRVRDNKTETPEEKEAFDSMAEPRPTSDDCPYGQIRQLGDQLHNILCGLQDEPIADELSNAVSKLWSVRKPETPQQREERERLEAAYDLYLAGNEHCGFNSAKSFDEFKNDNFQLDFWLTIVDKTGYRKAK